MKPTFFFTKRTKSFMKIVWVGILKFWSVQLKLNFEQSTLKKHFLRKLEEIKMRANSIKIKIKINFFFFPWLMKKQKPISSIVHSAMVKLMTYIIRKLGFDSRSDTLSQYWLLIATKKKFEIGVKFFLAHQKNFFCIPKKFTKVLNPNESNYIKIQIITADKKNNLTKNLCLLPTIFQCFPFFIEI